MDRQQDFYICSRQLKIITTVCRNTPSKQGLLISPVVQPNYYDCMAQIWRKNSLSKTGLFKHFFVLIHQTFCKKGPETFGFGHPPHPSTQNSKFFGAQKVLQNFWIALEHPPPPWKKPSIRLHFFGKLSS